MINHLSKILSSVIISQLFTLFCFWQLERELIQASAELNLQELQPSEVKELGKKLRRVTIALQ